MTFQWIEPPTGELTRNLEEYGRKAYVAVHAVASRWGLDVQNQVRENPAQGGAPWEDRTGNARSGLFYAVDGFGLGEVVGEVDADAMALMRETSIEKGDRDTLIIAVGHTVFYGKFLELSRGGRYAIIMSKIESNLPSLERQLRDIFK